MDMGRPIGCVSHRRRLLCGSDDLAVTDLDPAVVSAFADRKWRLNNLYFVQDEYGQVYKFQMRPAQEALVDDMHFLNIVLKARQLGFSTLILLLALDCCLFNDHFSAGRIGATKRHAMNLLDRLKLPCERLHPALR